MQVESFLVASTLEAVMAQRLVRTLCPDCREPYRPKLDELPGDFPAEKLSDDTTLYRAAGCRACRHFGYRGRTGLFELLVTSPEVRKLAHDCANAWDIAQAARRQGMRCLREDGWGKVLDGRTTVEEVVRVTKENTFGQDSRQ
jgi:general secretion pathway protein E/type IV pilus assembly protein PilB